MAVCPTEAVANGIYGAAGPRRSRQLSWDREQRHTARAAWNAVASVPVNVDGAISASIFCHPGAELTIVARSAAFYAAGVPGRPGTPPDFAGRDEEVTARMASKDSPFRPAQATFVERNPYRNAVAV